MAWHGWTTGRLAARTCSWWRRGHTVRSTIQWLPRVDPSGRSAGTVLQVDPLVHLRRPTGDPPPSRSGYGPGRRGAGYRPASDLQLCAGGTTLTSGKHGSTQKTRRTSRPRATCSTAAAVSARRRRYFLLPEHRRRSAAHYAPERSAGVSWPLAAAHGAGKLIGSGGVHRPAT